MNVPLSSWFLWGLLCWWGTTQQSDVRQAQSTPTPLPSVFSSTSECTSLSLGLCQGRWVGTHTSHYSLFLLLAACVPQSSRAGTTPSFPLNIKLYGLVLRAWLLICQRYRKEARKSFLSKTPDFQVYCFGTKSYFEWLKLHIIFFFIFFAFLPWYS